MSAQPVNYTKGLQHSWLWRRYLLASVGAHRLYWTRVYWRHWSRLTMLYSGRRLVDGLAQRRLHWNWYCLLRNRQRTRYYSDEIIYPLPSVDFDRQFLLPNWSVRSIWFDFIRARGFCTQCGWTACLVGKTQLDGTTGRLEVRTRYRNISFHISIILYLIVFNRIKLAHPVPHRVKFQVPKYKT